METNLSLLEAVLIVFGGMEAMSVTIFIACFGLVKDSSNKCTITNSFTVQITVIVFDKDFSHGFFFRCGFPSIRPVLSIPGACSCLCVEHQGNAIKSSCLICWMESGDPNAFFLGAVRSGRVHSIAEGARRRRMRMTLPPKNVFLVMCLNHCKEKDMMKKAKRACYTLEFI